MRTVPFAPPYAALVVLAFSMACSSSQPSTDTAPAATVSGPGVVTGTATYRAQVTLPDDATFEAVLQDVSRVDAPPTAIGRQRIEDVSKSPISFAISFDPSLINPERNYVVRASIRVDERRIWVSSRAHSVLTHGTGNSVHIMLRRVGVADDKIDGDLLLAGEMTFLADAARLTECQTRRVFPISMEADYPELKLVYGQLSRAPGAPLYVTFDGTISERPEPAGSGRTTPTVVVREFIDGWPNQTCASSGENAPLLDTRWRITKLGEQRLTSVIGRTTPHLVLAGRGDSLTYSTTVGCNGIGGKATRTGNEIAFGIGTGTMMACGAPLDSLERQLLDALNGTVHWRVMGNTLEFSDEDDRTVVLFEATRKR